MFSKIVSSCYFIGCPDGLEIFSCNRPKADGTGRPERAQFVLSRLMCNEKLKKSKESNELCEIFYEEFHGIQDFSLVNNTYIAAGGQGMVFKCECFQEGIHPNITAQKGTI